MVYSSNRNKLDRTIQVFHIGWSFIRALLSHRASAFLLVPPRHSGNSRIKEFTRHRKPSEVGESLGRADVRPSSSVWPFEEMSCIIQPTSFYVLGI